MKNITARNLPDELVEQLDAWYTHHAPKGMRINSRTAAVQYILTQFLSQQCSDVSEKSSDSLSASTSL